MPLTLLLAERPQAELVTFANPASREDQEELLRGVASELPVTERLVFPLPDASTRRHPTPPRLMRQKHLDLWNALTPRERERTVVIAGPTASLMATAVDREVAALVALATRPGRQGRVAHPWRHLLGAFPEFDEIPEEAPAEPELGRWSARIGEALSRFDLLRSPDQVQIALEVAACLGMGPKKAARVAEASLAGASWDGPATAEPRTERHWIDEAVLSHSRSPTEARPKRLARP